MRIVENTDILLINVPLDRTLSKREEYATLSSMPPLGMLYIISTLKKEKFKVSFIDLSVEMFDRKEFEDALKRMNPRIAALSSYVESWKIQNSLAKRIKQMYPNTAIVAGGYCATFAYEEMLRTGCYDYIIRGEGEFAYISLVNYLIHNTGTIKDIENLIYLENGKVVKNAFHRIENIDELPIPERDVLNMDAYSYPFTISTARGCPGRCIFCSANAFWGNKVIMRSPESIIDEIKKEYLKFGMKYFFIIDDTFTINLKRTEKFCKLLDELSTELGVDFIWGCESRVDVIKADSDILSIMKKSGCNMIQFGMESGNDEVLKSLNKHITYAQVYQAVEKAYQAGLNINVSFMIGHHADTWETIEETVQKAVDLKKRFHANMIFSINTPYPGTELRNRLDELGVKLIEDDFSKLKMNDTAICTSHLTANEIRKAYSMATKMLYM